VPIVVVVFALAASSALVGGGIIGAFFRPPPRVLAVALAFASGALIAALAFDLFGESFRAGGVYYAGGGLLAGAAAFIGVDWWLDRRMGAKGDDASGFALLAAVVLDGIPENLALGISLLAATSPTQALSLLIGIFASNLPEALGGAQGMREQGRSRGFAVGTWAATAVVLAAAMLVGYLALEGLAAGTLSVLLAFAGGAVLASLADTLMPQAYQDGGPLVAFATVAGFFVAFISSQG
jgi:ZIP family zinc transporter